MVKHNLDEYGFPIKAVHKYIRISPPKSQIEKAFKERKKYDRKRAKYEFDEILDELEFDDEHFIKQYKIK
jgi:hypothetical protein